jgi:hypothetical protein
MLIKIFYPFFFLNINQKFFSEDPRKSKGKGYSFINKKRIPTRQIHGKSLQLRDILKITVFFG